MGKILQLTVTAGRGVQSGQQISLFSLLSRNALNERGEVLQDVSDGSDVVCNVGGLEELRCKAGVNKRKGETVSISEFFKIADLYREAVSPKGLAKGAVLSVDIEAVS